MRSPASAFAILVVIGGLAGCASSIQRDGEVPPGAIVETLTDDALLQRAAAAYDAGDYERALGDFDLLRDGFPASPLRPLALYDAGLCLEALDRHEEAVVHFRAYLETEPDRRDAIDARFHVGAGLEALQRWDEAAAVFQALLEERLSSADRLEAGARAGWALVNRSDLVAAERQLKAALGVWREDTQLQAARRDSWAALATFGLGEIYRTLTVRVPLRLPREQMERDLQEKSELFVRAEGRFLATLRFQHRVWSVAAGYRLGLLYEQFQEDLLAAEPPPELTTPALRAAYVDHLRAQTVLLLEKARIAYEKTVELSARMGVQGDEWAQKASEGLDRMDARLREETQQDDF